MQIAGRRMERWESSCSISFYPEEPPSAATFNKTAGPATSMKKIWLNDIWPVSSYSELSRYRPQPQADDPLLTDIISTSSKNKVLEEPAFEVSTY